jgi:hypothetical protein
MAILGATTHTVTRSATGLYVDGDYTRTTTTLDISASVQPLTGVDLQRLPEAERTAGRYKLYTETELLTSRELSGELLAADTVPFDGLDMRVIRELDMQMHVGGVPHYKYVLGVPDGEDGL